ncbi:MAG TPA: nucleotidyltransferase family protein [Roseiarcus sp.]|nr:nucleotidyltransferase family protein [Roseiarcus sp.]
MTKIAAVVLAAGRSSRFAAAGGGEATKLIAPLAGKALTRFPVEAALASAARPVIVVTGHAREAVEAALQGLPLIIAHNPNFASGLASSLQAGIAALPAGADGALVLLGDMPAVTSTLLDRLIARFVDQPDALAVAPISEGRRGNPVLLSRKLFGAVAKLTGDEGARRLLADLSAEQILPVPVEGAEASLDVDTPEALATARRALRP